MRWMHCARQSAGELDNRRRHPKLLRGSQPILAGSLPGVQDRRQAHQLSLHPDKTRLIVRLLCGDPTQAARARQTGNLCLHGVHIHLRKVTPRALPVTTEDPQQPHARETSGDQRGATPSQAPAYPRTGAVAASSGRRAYQIFCCAHQAQRLALASPGQQGLFRRLFGKAA